MQTDAGSHHNCSSNANDNAEPNLNLKPFDVRVSACLGPVMDYMFTDFGVGSSNHFPFRAGTNRQMQSHRHHCHCTYASANPSIGN